MTRDCSEKVRDLRRVLTKIGRVAVAVSGGVDSMTLSVIAHRQSSSTTGMFHAVSPAVSARATRRVKRYAQYEGWNLRIMDAGEFSDNNYMRNPANRCYYCKSNLYREMSSNTMSTLVSGTNLDDLNDYRPGLGAADENSVRHPYVEAGIDKEGVRAIARSLGLLDLAALPAAPCLSSRIETGIDIDSNILAAVDRVERLLYRKLKPRTIRCRVRARGIVIELNNEILAALPKEKRRSIIEVVTKIFHEAGLESPVSFASYLMGSAFVLPPSNG